MQYGEYLKQVVSGNFGTTITDNQPVTSVIARNGGGDARADASPRCSSRSSSACRSACSPAGCATPGSTSRARLFGIVIYAAPVFFLGLLAQELFGHVLGWLPTSSQAAVRDAARHQDAHATS